MRMPGARRGDTFAAMRLRARRLWTRFRRFDQVRVDELLALALLLEIELQVWLSPYIHHRVPAAVGGRRALGGGRRSPPLAVWGRARRRSSRWWRRRRSGAG